MPATPRAGCPSATTCASCAVGWSSPHSRSWPARSSGWYLYDPVYAHLTQPLLDIARQRGDEKTIALNFAGLTAAFCQRVSIAIFVGVIVSSPVWLYQLWAFIVPGLTQQGAAGQLAFIAATVPLFLAGCWFAYETLPKAVQMLISFTPQGAVELPRGGAATSASSPGSSSSSAWPS